MPNIYSVTDGKTVGIKPSETILEAMQGAGIPHTSACGGQAYCSTCRIIVQKGVDLCSAPTPAEKALSKRLHFPVHVRLACQTRVSGDVGIRRLVIDEEDLELVDSQFTSVSVGVEQPLGIIVASVRGATDFDEVNFPYDILYIMGRYFRSMHRTITTYGGSIDNYMGSRLIATFRAGDSEDAKRAIWTSLEMVESVRLLNQSLQKLAYQPLEIAVGVHYGPAIMVPIATSGTTQTLTPLGGAISTASNILEANRKLGTQVLVSEAAFKAVETQLVPGRIETIGRSGKANAMMVVYEVLEMQGKPPRKAVIPGQAQEESFSRRLRSFMQRLGVS
ncbi:MAG: adenylate/guanylate cyclase domain-containing protein [Cyanobacteria bacterium J06641_5]